MEIKEYIYQIENIYYLKSLGLLTENEVSKLVERFSAIYELSPIYL